MIRVKDAMTLRPRTIDPEAPVATAIAVMREHGVRHLPVVDDRGHVVGVLSDRDLRGVAFGPVIAPYLSPAARERMRAVGDAVERLRVRDVMTWSAVTTVPDAPLARAAALMLEHACGCLPVMEGERLIGLVSERDALRALADTLPAVRGLDPDTYFW